MAVTRRHLSRPAAAGGLAVALLGLGAAQAQAHAIVSPAVAKAGALEQYTLSVPTEKEKATTTRIELDLPAGFSVDSYEPEQGWRRRVKAKGSGEGAVVQRIVWSGGRVPTEEDAVFRFNASAARSQTYVFKVRQTYSDGSVVDWSGPESSDTPAPRVEARSSFGGGGSTGLSVAALVVGGLALLLGIVGLAGRGRSLA